MTFKTVVYRCEWTSNRVMFHQRSLPHGDPCPEGWHETEELARADVARRLSQMASDLMRAAYDVTRDRRGD
jgi:hypothetical protein